MGPTPNLAAPSQALLPTATLLLQSVLFSLSWQHAAKAPARAGEAAAPASATAAARHALRRAGLIDASASAYSRPARRQLAHWVLRPISSATIPAPRGGGGRHEVEISYRRGIGGAGRLC